MTLLAGLSKSSSTRERSLQSCWQPMAIRSFNGYKHDNSTGCKIVV